MTTCQYKVYSYLKSQGAAKAAHPTSFGCIALASPFKHSLDALL